MSERIDKARSVMKDIRMKIRRENNQMRMGEGAYTIHPPGSYTDDPPHRDYPIVTTKDATAAQVIEGCLEEQEVHYEQIDIRHEHGAEEIVAYVLYVKH